MATSPIGPSLIISFQTWRTQESSMGHIAQSAQQPSNWSKEALAMAAQAKVLSGNKLEQLVISASTTLWSNEGGLLAIHYSAWPQG